MSIEEVQCQRCGQKGWIWISDAQDDTLPDYQGFTCFNCGVLSPISLDDSFLEFLHDAGQDDPETWCLVEVYKTPNEAAERRGLSGEKFKGEKS